MNTSAEIQAVKSELRSPVSEGSSLCLPWRVDAGKGWSLRLRVNVAGQKRFAVRENGIDRTKGMQSLALNKIEYEYDLEQLL